MVSDFAGAEVSVLVDTTTPWLLLTLLKVQKKPGKESESLLLLDIDMDEDDSSWLSFLGGPSKKVSVLPFTQGVVCAAVVNGCSSWPMES